MAVHERSLEVVPPAVRWSAGAAGRRMLRLLRTRSGVLFAALVVLNLVDLVTTRLVLDRGGTEGNPVMAPIIHNIAGAFAVKVLCLALIGVLISRSRRSPRTLLVLAAVDVWYLAVVAWNLHVLRLIA